jgi:UDP-glucuronate decarboxylase
MKTGVRSNVSIIRRLATSKSFSFKQGDIVAPLITDGHFDAIYNLACPASPVAYQADPIQTLKSSVLGTLNLLELAREHGATMIHASTSEIYGDPLQHPQAESYWGNVNPIGPRACYDEGKRCAETLCFDYRRTQNLHVGVARIFNTYGPRMSVLDGRVVSNFIVQALQNSNITVYGDGRQTRSFCYVDDLIDGLIKLMALSPSVTGPINLGNPQEYSIVDLAALIIDLTGSRSRIIHEPLPIDDPQQRCPDISRAERELKWSPTVPLKEGLNRTIDYFDAVIKREQTGRPSSWSSEELLVAS